MELRLNTWEFVRLMVQCEEANKKNPPKTIVLLWESWADIWTPLDATLNDLIEADFNAYSEMMMEDEVVIQDVTPDQLQATITELGNVKTAMESALKSTAGTNQIHAEVREAMEFEITELTTRIENLQVMGA